MIWSPAAQRPYRLFTSRAEYRLLLREDNANLRLRETGRELGLVDDETFAAFQKKRQAIADGFAWLNNTMLKPGAEINRRLAAKGSANLKQMISLAELLRRPELTIDDLPDISGLELKVAPEIKFEVQLQVKYEGYIKRQEEQVNRFKKMENIALPEDMVYEGLPGLSTEVIEKLSRVRPRSLGQASRISGITPAALSVLQVQLKKLKLL